MEILLNLGKIKNKMQDIPSSQKLNAFFDGAINNLDENQIVNLISIIEKNNKDILLYLNKSLNWKKEYQ